ncbi:hypothetical protein D3C74_416600 [compost metagenome]
MSCDAVQHTVRFPIQGSIIHHYGVNAVHLYFLHLAAGRHFVGGFLIRIAELHADVLFLILTGEE